MAKWEQIEQVNGAMKPTDVKGRPYIEVNERIKGFRKLYPDGFIRTEILSNENGVCVMQAIVGYYTEREERILGSGLAYEKEDSSFINKTSYIENCETSAVGRALGMCGFGIDTSVASAEEVQNAINNQNDERKATPNQIKVLAEKYTGTNLEKLLKANNVTKLEDLPMQTASSIISKLKKN